MNGRSRRRRATWRDWATALLGVLAGLLLVAGFSLVMPAGHPVVTTYYQIPS